MSESILVTGGAGFIGSHLVDALLAQGHHVRVMDNLEPQVHGGLAEQGLLPEYLNPEVEFLQGDVQDKNCVEKALKGIDVVFHEAAMVGVGQSMYHITRYTQANTLGAAVLLQSIIDSSNRPRKLIVASSMSIYGEGAYNCSEHGIVFPKLRKPEQLVNHEWEMYCPIYACNNPVKPVPTPEDKPLFPTSIYAINKRDHEEMFLAIGHAYKIPTVALRYFNAYGTRQSLSNPYTGVAAIFAGRLLNRKQPVIFEDGLQSRDFIHISDIVQANLLVMDNPQADYQVYNVGSGHQLTILDVANSLRKQMDVDISPEITGQFRAGDIRHCFSDISRLAKLGFLPRVQFSSGILELVNWVSVQKAENQFEKARQELTLKGLAY